MSQSIANEIQIESRERRPLRLDDILMNRWFLHTVSVSLFLGLWYWTVYMGVFGRGLCYPHEVLQEIGNLMTRRLAGKGLWDHAWDSTRRVFIGFGIACALGIPLGFFMGINKYFNAFFNPIFNLIKPMPPISWVSLSILWLGIGEDPKIFIIAIGAFVPIVLNAYNGIRLIDEELYDVVRMAGGGRMKEIVEVSFPAAVPSIFAGLQISLSGAWSCVLAAELVSARSGLGFVIVQGMNSGKASMVIAGMLLIALIASLCSYGIDSLEKKICPWRREIM